MSVASRFLLSCAIMLAVMMVGCGSVPESANEDIAQTIFANHMLVSNNGTYAIGYDIVDDDELIANAPHQPPLNELFDIKVAVGRRGTLEIVDEVNLFADAGMPEHMHGMNVEPTVTRLDDGSFLVQGMLFHMPGRWELYFDITKDGVTERAQTEIILE